MPMRCPVKFWPTQCWPLLRPGLPALQAGWPNRLHNMIGLPGAFWKAAFSIGPKIGHMTPRSGWANDAAHRLSGMAWFDQRNSERVGSEFRVYADFLPARETLKQEPPAAKPP